MTSEIPIDTPSATALPDPDDDPTLPGPRPVSAVAGHFPALPPIPASRPIAMRADDPSAAPVVNEPARQPSAALPAHLLRDPEAARLARQVNAGRLGGLARAAALSPERRRELAAAASRARWGAPRSRCTECGRPCVGHASLCTYHAVLERRRERQDAP